MLRLGPGDKVKLFDDRTGEWLAEIAEAGKKRVTLIVGERLRERETVPDLWLLFAPIKRGRIDWLVEKATELGVARLLPVITRRTSSTGSTSSGCAPTRSRRPSNASAPRCPSSPSR